MCLGMCICRTCKVYVNIIVFVNTETDIVTHATTIRNIVRCTMYIVECSVYIVKFTIYKYIVHSLLYLHIINLSMYIIRFTIHAIHLAIY